MSQIVAQLLTENDELKALDSLVKQRIAQLEQDKAELLDALEEIAGLTSSDMIREIVCLAIAKAEVFK